MAKGKEVHTFGTHLLEIRVGLTIAPTSTVGELNDLAAKVQKLVADQFPKGTQVVASLKAEVHAFGS